MQHARKMVLIAPEALDKLKSTPAPLVNSLETIDTEMSVLLNNKKLNDHDKWILYEQILQKYTSLKPMSLRSFFIRA